MKNFFSLGYQNRTHSLFSSYLCDFSFLSHLLSPSAFFPATKSVPGFSSWLSSLTLDNLIWSYDFNCHLYAVNSHIYIWFSTSSMNSRFLCPVYCLISPIETSNRHLHLNISKTDILSYHHNHLLYKPANYLVSSFQ